jgi:Bacterial surface proteins containing Ig-like domains
MLLKGNSSRLVATLLPENATNSTVDWSSSNPSVATVDVNGTVMAVASGTTNIIASSTDGNFTASCSVIVIVNVSSITLSVANITLEKGKSTKLFVTVYPNDATDKTIVWSSSDANIANVDKDGNVQAINGGNVIITATSADDKISAKCSVAVTVPVQGISIDKNELTLVKGQSATLKATIYPSDATLKDVLWSSDNPNVANVDNGTVKAVGVGTANITVESRVGNKRVSCKVKVEKSNNIDYNPYGDGQQW